MKAFWIFAGLLTLAYIIYYVVNFCLDLYGKPKEQEQPIAEEDFDLKGMQVMEEAKAVGVTDGGFRIGESETVVKPQEDAHPAEVDSPAPKLDATGAPLTPVQQKIEDVKAKMEETELEMSRENTADWFKDCYGIVRAEDIEKETIRIRAFGQEVFYMRDLPLHHSQKEVETTPEWSDFEILMRPTADFFSPLLARGPMIKVLEPQWLAEEIRNQHLAAA